MAPSITPEALQTCMEHPLASVHTFSTIDSTNTYAKQLAENGAPEGTLVLAEHQTAGRGRMGRSFFSPAGTGLYMSLILRPVFSPSEVLSVTACAAVAVCEAVEALSGRKAGIKWVNDVYLDNRKVCGILTEAAFVPGSNSVRYAVLGIGVNTTPPEGDFPPELAGIAAAVFNRNDADMRLRLAAAVLDRFLTYYPSLTEKNFYSGYRDRLFLRGQPVEILWGSDTGEGICLDVDRDFRLVVRMPDGSQRSLSSGEVRVRPMPEKENA